jgi:hypothetical protein
VIKKQQLIKMRQKRTSLTIELPSGDTYEIRLSVRIFRKFGVTVGRYINEILDDASQSFKDYYVNTLSTYCKTHDVRFILNEEFIQTVIDNVDLWLEKNKKRFPVGSGATGVLNETQLMSLFATSFYLKMFSLFMYTDIGMIEEEQKTLFKRLTKKLCENKVDAFLFEFVRLKFLAKASHSFWSWISSSKFQDISYHITNTYYTIISQILLQVIEGYNPIAFIKSVVEGTIYYLCTDVYLDEIKYMEQETKKLRFVKSYSLIEKQVLKAAHEQIIFSVKSAIGHSIFLGKNVSRNYKPILYYITLPLMTKILKVPYIYFYSLRDTHYLNFFTALLLEEYAPQLTTLRQMCKCYCVAKPSRGRAVASVLETLKPLYEFNHPLQAVFIENQSFDLVMKHLLTYDYWDMQTHQPVEFSAARLAFELKTYYERLILDDKYGVILSSVRTSGFEIGSNTSNSGHLTFNIGGAGIE